MARFMKFFLTIIVLLNVVAYVNHFFPQIMEILTSTTFISGHGFSGTIETWQAILCVIAPALIASTVLVAAYVKHKVQIKTQKQKG